MQTARKVVVGALALVVVASGCSGGGRRVAEEPDRGLRGGAGPGTPFRSISVGGTGGERFLASALSSFDACDDLLAHTQAAALERVGPWGLGGGWEMFAEGAPMTTVAGAAMAVDDAGGGSAGERATSGTNNQVAGVDEADLVKTDGLVLVAVAGGRLEVVDVRAATPVALSSLALDDLTPTQLFLAGTRVWVLATTAATGGMWGPWGYGGQVTTTLVEVDLTDPAAPAEVGRLTTDGALVSARLSEGALRLVVRATQPNGLVFEQPEGNGLRAERAALAANRAVIEASEAADWLPWAVLTTSEGTTTEGSLVDCDAVATPEGFGGFGVLSVVTVDAGAPLAVRDAVAVLSSGETVYASAERLYVATTAPAEGAGDAEVGARSMPVAPATDTALHAFDVSDPATTTYVASGTVPGRLLNQFSMDEHEGVLRVATTRGQPWGGDTSDSVVTTLGLDGEALVHLGQVDGLGRGEAIQSVRFLGDVGYVVTFRQTDPLYTVDLADPTRPTVVGELKINGWSAYLHPVADGFLIGVGQDATDTGAALGTQVSLFDVRDPAAPTRVAQHLVADSWSEAQADHRAFLHWPATGTTVVPVWRYDGSATAEVLRSHDGVLDVVGTLRHAEHAGGADGDPTIRRSMVVGDVLLTLSDRGLLASGLADLAELAWVPWG